MSQMFVDISIFLLTFLTLCGVALSLFDPLSLSLIAGGASLVYNRGKVWEYTYCQLNECCIDSHIPANITALSQDLEENVFGQHIVQRQLVAALKSHYTHLDSSTKPLVLSFHGTPGTGKNYLADHIAKHVYKYGVSSYFVKKFMGRTDFPLESDVRHYQITLRTTIINAVNVCPRTLFIFDEVDKIPVGVFEALTSLLDHHHSVEGATLRFATFIFLSNAGGTEISAKLLELTENGALREETQLFNFEKILEGAAYNVNGGLRKTSMIEGSLIDHYVPFLPLEKRHIEKCIIAEFKRLGVDRPAFTDIEEISNNYVTYYKNIFSTSGCKRLSKKVAMYVADKYK
ncbi:Torsin-like protein [Pseudolycoriella hygida]|uniref:Torsin-like protein n=1 Tax=Pseudolycoriella hygida TaxID=35572 RepID=A0A9Q0RVZ1_9DIPT|nr:Torsin-like protein [Pseudolycoriella hygida]